MNFELNEQQLSIQKMARDFTEKVVMCTCTICPWPETIVEISVVRDSAFSQAGQLVLTNAKKETIPS